jgi:hypothetical protein
LINWKFLRFCKQGNKQGSFASGHKPGGLVLVLASGLSDFPKNARDLTFQPFVGIMGADRSSYFMLNGDIIKVVLAGVWKFVRSPGVEVDDFSKASIANKATCC